MHLSHSVLSPAFCLRLTQPSQKVFLIIFDSDPTKPAALQRTTCIYYIFHFVAALIPEPFNPKQIIQSNQQFLLTMRSQSSSGFGLPLLKSLAQFMFLTRP